MNRRSISLLVLTVGLVFFQPVIAEAIEDRILFCSSVGERDQKLACYEAIAASLRKDDPTPPVKPEKPPENQQVTKPRGDFGKQKRERADEISAAVDEVQYDGRGKVYVRLDSGQVWYQVDSERVTLSPGDRIVIRRGAFSAYFMQPEGSNKRIKVRRQD